MICIVLCTDMIFLLEGVCGTPTWQQRESPFYLLGKVVMQQSYVCALIAMMVTHLNADLNPDAVCFPFTDMRDI